MTVVAVDRRPARRPQEQRRAETIRRVLDAAMALISPSGSRTVTLAQAREAAGNGCWKP